MLILFRHGVLATLLVSLTIWGAANYFKINLPANTPGEGWFFNPFAWQLLFTTGAAAAVLGNRHEITGRGAAVAIAGLYVGFSFIYAAPWVPISWLPDEPLLPPGLLGDVSKPDLSAWRFLHVIALAYVAGSLIAPSAPWLSQGIAHVVALCGRHALEMFALGTMLSFIGWIVLDQLGTTATLELAVNTAGIATMVFVARYLNGIKASRPQRLVAPDPS